VYNDNVRRNYEPEFYFWTSLTFDSPIFNQIKSINEVRGMEEKQNYWMLVWNAETGDFKNAKFSSTFQESEATDAFENTYPNLKVIHIGQGEEPPKTYRSLLTFN
jgi:hypothetical protein